MFGAFIHGKDILASIFKKPFNCVMISHLGRIVIDPEIMVGKPVIKGTRITVELILRLLAKGLKVDEILEDYRISRRRTLELHFCMPLKCLKCRRCIRFAEAEVSSR